MPDIWALMRAIRRSGLPAPERHTLLTLTTLVDPETGLIPDRFMPSLTDLSQFTGLGRSTVVRALNAAENGGWIKRTVPTKKASQRDKERTSYLLLIPAGVPSDNPEDPDGASARAGLVPERDQPEGWSQSGTSARAGLGLVPERDGASARAGHKELNLVYQDEPPPPTEEGSPSEQDAADGTLGVDFGKPVAPKPRTAKKAATKAARKNAPKKTDTEETHGQRVNRVTKLYTDNVKLTDFHGVRGVVDAAFKSNDYSEQQITAAIRKLAEGRDPVTRNTLRIAIEGQPTWAQRNQNSNPGQYRNPDDDSVYDDWSAVTR